MKILLVNDDGINSKKLHLTKEVLKEFGDVYVVAPSKEQSAKSMSLTFGGTTYKQIDEHTYQVDGTPADTTIFALLVLDLKPDLVVSGTNNGYNIGIDIRYSGTVGAALQALYFGIPAIAVSSDYNRYEMLNVELKQVITYILENQLLSKEYVLNVNLPQDKFIQSNGIKHTKVYPLLHQYYPVLHSDSYEPKRLFEWIEEIPNDSEQQAYLEGYTSISKVYL